MPPCCVSDPCCQQPSLAARHFHRTRINCPGTELLPYTLRFSRTYFLSFVSLFAFRASFSSIRRAHAAMPSGSFRVAFVMSSFCSEVRGIRMSVSSRNLPSFRGLAMPSIVAKKFPQMQLRTLFCRQINATIHLFTCPCCEQVSCGSARSESDRTSVPGQK
jgi:hypothetical protein